MDKRRLTPEHRQAILGDLMQRYPRGNNGKLRHYHYETKRNNSWGDTHRLVDPVINMNHPKLPPQDDDTYLGWKISDIWLISGEEHNIRPELRTTFPDLTSRQLTMRARRVSRRIKAIRRDVEKNGRPGMYKAGESYGSDFQTYIYATSLGEADQLAEMFLSPAAKGKYLTVRFIDYAGPEDIGTWHALGKELVMNTVNDLETRMQRMQEQINAIHAFQHSAEMVSANISAMAAEKNLRDMEG